MFCGTEAVGRRSNTTLVKRHTSMPRVWEADSVHTNVSLGIIGMWEDQATNFDFPTRKLVIDAYTGSMGITFAPPRT